MKKLVLIAFVGLFSVGVAMAKPKFKSIDNNGNATTIVVEDKKAGDNLSVTSAVFHNDGKDLPAKSMQANLINGVATITMKFDRCTVFNNCYVVIAINGKEERVSLNLGGVVKSLGGAGKTKEE